MKAMRSLLDPKAVAVVGASQRRGRGTNVVANLRDCGFAGEIFAVNPRYQDVLGYKCFPSVSDLPASVHCLVAAVAADAASDILDDPDVTVVAAVVEELKNPQKLIGLAAKANARRKSLVLFQAGRSAAGRIMVQSHTGALAGNAEILAAFLRRCGIVQVERYDEFVETVELFAIAPRDETVGNELVVISGSGGGAAIAADALQDAGAPLASLHPATKERIASVLPEFGSITNPIDGTGAIYDDPALLPKIFDAIVTDPARPIIAASVAAKPVGNETMRRFARTFADAARTSGRTVVAYQYSPLGGPLDSEIISTLHGAQVPLLLGISNAMGALKHLPLRRAYWARAVKADAPEQVGSDSDAGLDRDLPRWDFLTARQLLVASGVPVVGAALAHSEDEAVAVLRPFGTPAAVKAKPPALLP